MLLLGTSYIPVIVNVSHCCVRRICNRLIILYHFYLYI